MPKVFPEFFLSEVCMVKKVLSLLLLAVLCFSLTACNGEPFVGIDSSALEPFVIGGIGPLTEEGGAYGASVFRGAQLAVEEINATGGVNGFRLVLNFQDSKADPKTAETLYNKLMDNDMKVLLESGDTPEVSGLSDRVSKDGLLTLTAAADSSVLLEGGNRFRICPSHTRMGTLMANFIADQRLAQKVLLLTEASTETKKEQTTAFSDTFLGRGGTVDVYPISEADLADFSNVLNLLQNSPWEMIYLDLSPAVAQEFLDAYQWDGGVSEKKIVGNRALEGILENSKRPERWEGAFVATSFVPNDESVVIQNFVASYTEAYKIAPDRYAADGYDAVYAVAEALKKAGITPDNVDNADFNKKMVSAMTKITVNGVGGATSWTTDGETTRPAYVKVIKNGEYANFIKESAGT